MIHHKIENSVKIVNDIYLNVLFSYNKNKFSLKRRKGISRNLSNTYYNKFYDKKVLLMLIRLVKVYLKEVSIGIEHLRGRAFHKS